MIGEARVGAVLVEGGNDTDGFPLKQSGTRIAADAESARNDLVEFGILQDRVDALAVPAREDPAMLGVGRDLVSDQAGDALAFGDDDAQTSRGCGNGDEHLAGADQLAQVPGDQLEEEGHVSFLEDAVGERVERLELADPVDGPIVDLHLFDRDRGLGGEKRDELFVFLREFAAILLCQVQVAVDDSAYEDRNTEEAPHERVPGRKAEELPLFRHVGDAHRPRVPEEDAENAVIARQVADPGSRRLVDPCRDEVLEVSAGAVEDAERRVARRHQPCRHLHRRLQGIGEGCLGADRDTRLDELP